jgi:hypothetical protein
MTVTLLRPSLVLSNHCRLLKIYSFRLIYYFNVIGTMKRTPVPLFRYCSHSGSVKLTQIRSLQALKSPNPQNAQRILSPPFHLPTCPGIHQTPRQATPWTQLINRARRTYFLMLNAAARLDHNMTGQCLIVITGQKGSMDNIECRVLCRKVSPPYPF